MKKNLGQCFLRDQAVIESILHEAQVKKSENVLEIGCGDGALSQHLVGSCQSLTIIELDKGCLEKTASMLQDAKNVKFIHGDILKTKFNDIKDARFRLIANIPYYITAKIIKLIIDDRDRIEDAIIMVQKEFAEKLIAPPGSDLYSSLGIYTRFFLGVDILFNVSRESFFPVPKVDSAVIRLTPLKKKPYEVDEDLFFAIVQTLFWGRRKKVTTCLSKSPFLDLKPGFKGVPSLLSFGDARGETLSMDNFFQIYTDLLPFYRSLKVR
jgi:16S rRNA (adenine1518-N6/adenine1519-N6)-dimethyltransferase